MSDEKKCIGCMGTGQRLARLSFEQDMSFANRGLPIPKVECWYCNGEGYITTALPDKTKPLENKW